jgi:hypothetical protein
LMTLFFSIEEFLNASYLVIKVSKCRPCLPVVWCRFGSVLELDSRQHSALVIPCMPCAITLHLVKAHVAAEEKHKGPFHVFKRYRNVDQKVEWLEKTLREYG